MPGLYLNLFKSSRIGGGDDPTAIDIRGEEFRISAHYPPASHNCTITIFTLTVVSVRVCYRSIATRRITVLDVYASLIAHRGRNCQNYANKSCSIPCGAGRNNLFELINLRLIFISSSIRFVTYFYLILSIRDYIGINRTCSFALFHIES